MFKREKREQFALWHWAWRFTVTWRMAFRQIYARFPDALTEAKQRPVWIVTWRLCSISALGLISMYGDRTRQMPLDINQCMHLCFTRSSSRPLNTLTLNDLTFQAAFQCKYIGVYLPTDMSCNVHVAPRQNHQLTVHVVIFVPISSLPLLILNAFVTSRLFPLN